MTLEAAQVLQNRYRIVSPLKRGGMGAIYRAWDTRLSIPVALKEMIPQPDLEPHTLSELRQQFQREATILARLDHSNLVDVTDFFEEAGNAYLVMDFVEGESLAERIERQGALSEEEVLVWADQLLDALVYCHEQKNVLHRDIKPQNVIIRPDGRAILVDFGLVKLWDPHAPETRTAVRGAGTPEYAPPEQYDMDGTGHTDPRTDIYSLGATLYHALVGQAPPTATQRIVNPASLAPVRTVNPHVSPRVETALMKALELQPAARFQNTTEMRAVLKGTAPIPPPLQPPTATKVLPGQPPPARRTATWIGKAAGVALVVVLLGGAILGAVWLFGDRQPSPPATSQVPATFTSEAVPEVVSTATDVPPTPTSVPTPQAPTSTPPPTSTPQPTATPMPKTPTPAETPTPAAAALVLADGANLRPGASTWWRVRETLPAGTELELTGYDPNFPDWVYVRTVDGASSGWAQIADLEINRDLADLPRVTPIPTLTSTPRATEVIAPTLPSGCVTGPLELDTWSVGAVCIPGGWRATIYAEARGGNCVYTYAWEGIVQIRSISGPATFEVTGGTGAIVGTVSVTSAGQTVSKGVYVQKPDCD